MKVIGEVCQKCKSEMRKGAKMDSGNSRFQEYICPKCGFKKTKAEGVMK